MLSTLIATVLLTVASANQVSYSNELPRDRCTAIAVGPKASVDGSTFTTHTNDCTECDFRINKVPARDWPEGAKRPVYLYASEYPRYVRNDRGFTWSSANLDKYDGLWNQNFSYSESDAVKLRNQYLTFEDKTIIGYIPQVAHTYAMVEGLYGIMNEHQVAIGESTCSAKLVAAPAGAAGGKALLDVVELSQIALERSKTALEAIQTMGELATTYGYYSCEWKPSPRFGLEATLGEGGEGLTVIDPTSAWIFHVMPDPTGASAIWCAERIPDDHVAVIANSFVIREVIEYDESVPISERRFLYSANMFDVAEKMGWWKRSDGKPLDFTDTFSPIRYRDDLSSMRVWRVFDYAAPSLHLPPSSGIVPMGTDPAKVKYELIVYPSSIKVEKKLSLEDIMTLNRDHYEGTKFSLDQGLAAGPYGDPTRYDIGALRGVTRSNVTIDQLMSGEYGRAISIHRTAYSFVAQPNAKKPDSLSLLWFSQYAPASSSFTPIYINSEMMPPSWTTGSQHKYDTKSAWWNFCAVGNYANRFYNFSMVTVKAVQDQIQRKLNDGVKELESKIIKNGYDVALITDFTVDSGEYISNTYKELLPFLFTHYRDGYVVNNLTAPKIQYSLMSYPTFWLQQTGYFNQVGVAGGSLFAPSPVASDGITVAYSTFVTSIFVAIFCSGFIFAILGYVYAKRGDFKVTGLWNEDGRSRKVFGTYQQNPYVEIPSAEPL